MSNFNNTWIGSSNDASPADQTNERELFLQVFGGEVIESFDKNTFLMGHTMIKTIESGRSASFPVLGYWTAAHYHTPGTQLTGQDFLQSEKVIHIDALLTVEVFIDKLQESMAHYDVRGPYSRKMGEALALAVDNALFREAALGAAATALVSTLYNGLTTTDSDLGSATAADKWAAWEDALFGATENFDNKFVPEAGRMAWISPSDYLFLVRYMGTNGMSMINRDVAGRGSYADGKIAMVGGIDLVKCNTLPTSNYSGEDYHAVDMRYCKGIILGEGALGTVKKLDMTMDVEYMPDKKGTFIGADLAMGHGWVRPESCVLLVTQ